MNGDALNPTQDYEESSEAIRMDFDVRRAARRKIIDTLESHQRSEAKVANLAARSLINFYRGALEELGKWLYDAYIDKNSEQLNLVAPQHAPRWWLAVLTHREALVEVKEKTRLENLANENVIRIEPNPLLRHVFIAPEKASTLKLAMDDARRTKENRKTAEARLNSASLELTSRTKLVLDELLLNIDDFPEGTPATGTIGSLTEGHLNLVKEAWTIHKNAELEDLKSLSGLIQVLAGTGSGGQ